MIMTKIDFKKEFRSRYKPSAKAPVLVDIPPMNFLMVDGEGHPENNLAWEQAIQALYPLSYGLKFMFKKATPPDGYFDYVVPPLEGLWWLSEGDPDFYSQNRENWRWTMMIMVPDFFTEEMVVQKQETLKREKDLPGLARLRFERFEEGKAVQIMHIGPYANEGPTLEKLHGFIQANGYQFRGKHHEVYLSDPRRANPETMKTVLRHPVIV